MNPSDMTIQALNKAMLEAVEFIHAEGWDAAPTLFALVNTELLVDALPTDDDAPLTLVVQEGLPEHISGGSDELGEFVSQLAWPPEVAGVILAQEIMFAAPDSPDDPRPARLFSGVLRGGPDQTLLQIRPSEAELAEPFAADRVELRGGTGVAPGVIAALRYTLEEGEL
ncbi:PPA1309 family protein [Corynebacterium sp.]|uniref:PPA1309 family protein n=1 Tax=Corynebacterium sp. TaxID=1720 RepID=UPI0026DB0664|nr:PPA1309 family protein [Corynebacterium sp.]MDO5077286.1 PPA1309 family protein [Corynebacterium sp.]